MQFNHDRWLGAEYAAALANAPVTAAGYQQVVDEFVRPSCRVHGADVAPIGAWVARFRPIFGEAVLDRQVELVNSLLAESVNRPVVSRHDGLAPHLHFADPEEELVTRLRGRTAIGLAQAICDGAATRLGRCARPECGIVYVDTSRNGRRRYCAVRCANRVRTAEHRQRRRHLTSAR
jgi:CGNR zinc finger protein